MAMPMNLRSFFLVGSLSVGLLLSAQPHKAIAQSVSVSFTTTDAGGKRKPKNIVAVWAEQSDGTFIKTLGRWSKSRTKYLVAWNKASGGDTDAVSGATRKNHNDRLTVLWDLTDKTGAAISQGVYRIRMELADRNSTKESQNNQGLFMVNHNGTSLSETSSNNGFENVTVDYLADGNVGDQCIDDDGTCPAGCTMSNDNDCSDGGGGGGGGNVAANDSGLGFILVVGLFFLLIGDKRNARKGNLRQSVS